MKTELFAALIASSSALSGPKVYPSAPHWNEDPRSRPEVLSGNDYLTSTQARYVSEKYTGHIKAEEPKGTERYWLRPYNDGDKEYSYMQQSGSSSSSSSSSSSDDEENVMIGQRWRVSPDYGELDDHIMSREQDIASGKKESGWTNPLGWSDTGNDDDQVVL